MIPAPERFAGIRQRRSRRTQAAGLLATLKPAADESVQPLDWALLLEVPEWCHWPSSRREYLVLIAGALFAAPAMRLWIEARRIAAAKSVIGADAFDKVMAHESLPHAAPQLPAGEDIRELLQAAGAGVLLGSLSHDGLRNGLAALLPPPVGTLPHTVAAALTADALVLVAMLEQARETSGESS